MNTQDFINRLKEMDSLEYITLKREALLEALTNVQKPTSEMIDDLVDQFERRIAGDEDSLIDFSSASFELYGGCEITLSDVNFYTSDFGLLLRDMLYKAFDIK